MIYDVKSKNISFFRVSKLLRDRGVKNNKFMLALYDESLVGVDPYSENLTVEQQFAIYRECRRNIWYFIREVVRIPADGSVIPYELNLGNATATYLRSLNKNIILLMLRQSGKTMSSVIFDVWNMCLVTKNSNEVYLNKGKADAVKNLKIFKDVRELLPKWMRDNYIEDQKKDIDNQETKLLAKRNNSIRVVAPGSDPDAADKAGRGLTVANIWFDEFAFMKYNDITYKAAFSAQSKASENAKKNGMPYGILITTTPNNIDEGTPGAFCYQMKENAAKWTVECFDIPEDKLDEYIRNNSQNDFVHVEYTYKELGRSEEWLQSQIRQLGGDMATVKRELLLVWPHSSDSAVFNEEQLSRVFDCLKPVKTVMMVNGSYPIKFYEVPDMNMNYILSCDVAGGLSSDNSVINIIHPEDFRIVGDFRNPKIDTDSFRKLIETLMTFYFRNALLVIEKTGIGLPLIDTLMKNPDIEPRMYREEIEQAGEKTQVDGLTVRRKTKRVVYGVDTSKKHRDQMIDLLMDIVENEYEKFVSENLYNDLVGLEKKKTGKIEHGSGRHDDSLMAYLIFRWAVFYGKCFRDRFGISSVPSRINVRTSSSFGDMSKITRIIEAANSQAVAPSSSAFDILQAQSDRIKQQNGERSDADRINAFMRMLTMNGDDFR